ncbi:type IV secretion system protein [Halomonas casei]|uniref:type IV secretion system protein n=1 Tax=Halomonas casei TaxID=2742613 RepID=UPI003CEFE4F2
MRTPRLFIAAAAYFAISGTAHAQIATIDVEAIMNMGKQLESMKNQLEQQQKMVRNMTEGLTDLGDEFFRETVNSMPENWEDALGSSGSYGSAGRQILAEREEERSNMDPADAPRQLNERLREQEATHLAMLQDVYENNSHQLQEMQQLASHIETADTQREVNDLQARIQTSQGAIEANNMRLQNLDMLNQAETTVLDQQRREAFTDRAIRSDRSTLRLVR